MKNFSKVLLPALALSFGIFTNSFASYEKNVVAGNLENHSYFGWSVAIDGDYAIVGQPEEDVNATNAGSAYIYIRDGLSWTQQAKLLADTPSGADYFGISVAIEGDYAVVGAWKDNENGNESGAIYVFKRSGTSWTQQARLSPADVGSNDEFGNAVAINGEYIIAGSYRDNNSSKTNNGSAYIFKRTGETWAEQAKLIPGDPDGYANFGYSVDIDGEYAAIGARLDDNGVTNAGSAYIFKRTGTSWAEEAKLEADAKNNGDEFGHSISLSGDYLLVGMKDDDDLANNAGAAIVFLRSGTSWTQQAKLTASDGAASDNFGWSVSIDGSYAVVGAYIAKNGSFTNAGAAYLYERSGTSWTQLAIYAQSDPVANDQLGFSIGLSGNFIIAGARYGDAGGTDRGEAYIFSRNPFYNGNVTQTVSSNSTISFDEGNANTANVDEDTGMDIAFTGVTNSADIQCESFPEAPTGTDGITGTVNPTRWVITDAGLAFTNAQIRIDMNTLPFTLTNPSAAVIYHRSTPGSGSFTGLATTVEGDELVANTPSFSEFVIGGGDTPLAIELDSFNARQIENSIQLSWTTASETENEGFNVYRKTGNGEFIKISSFKGNSELEGALNSTVSNNYSFVDNSEFRNGKTYTYFISDVETNGIETKHEEVAQTVKFVLGEEIVQSKLDYVLAQNFPNPFNPSTTINFQIAKEQTVKLEVYNLNGEIVKELVNEKMSQGSHKAVWNGTDNFGKTVSSGTYFYKISAGTFTQTNKMILLK